MEPVKYFFSYSRQNAEFVIKLATDLKNNGANVWLDQLEIAPGSRWDDSIESALNEAKGLIVVLSHTSVKSQNVLDEVSYAISQEKRIVPLMLENCSIPFRLARFQYIDFTKNYDTAFQYLLKTLNILQPGTPVTATAQTADVKPHTEEKTLQKEGEPSIVYNTHPGGAAGTSVPAAQQETEPSPYRKEKTGSKAWIMGASAVLLAAVITAVFVFRGGEAPQQSAITDKPADRPVSFTDTSSKANTDTRATAGSSDTSYHANPPDPEKVKHHNDPEHAHESANKDSISNDPPVSRTDNPTDPPAKLSPEDNYRQGMLSYYGNHEYDKGKKCFTGAANAGYLPARKELGKLYNPGNPDSKETKNTDSSIYWYKAAAAQNDAESMYAVAKLYFSKRDISSGAGWLTQAAANNNTSAMYDLGTYLLYGRYQFPHDDVKAATWLKKAMESSMKNNPDDSLAKYKALGYYGILMNEGRGGLQQNTASARRYISVAYAKTGLAYFNLYLNNIAVTPVKPPVLIYVKPSDTPRKIPVKVIRRPVLIRKTE